MTVWGTGAGMGQLVWTGREGRTNRGIKVLGLVMITMNASALKDTEVHSARRESLLVKLPLASVSMVAPV